MPDMPTALETAYNAPTVTMASVVCKEIYCAKLLWRPEEWIRPSNYRAFCMIKGRSILDVYAEEIISNENYILRSLFYINY